MKDVHIEVVCECPTCQGVGTFRYFDEEDCREVDGNCLDCNGSGDIPKLIPLAEFGRLVDTAIKDQKEQERKAEEERARQAYEERAKSRLAVMDKLEKKIDFDDPGWRYTDEGERWIRLMDEQAADEEAMGL